MKVLAVIHGIIISHLPHRESSAKCQTTGIQTHTIYLRFHVVCLPIVAISISSIKCLSLFAKMLPLKQKQTARQMFLMRKTWPGKVGSFKLVSGKVNVLYAYIIQGERDLTTPSLYMTMRWQAQVALFCHEHCVSISP